MNGDFILEYQTYLWMYHVFGLLDKIEMDFNSMKRKQNDYCVGIPKYSILPNGRFSQLLETKPDKEWKHFENRIKMNVLMLLFIILTLLCLPANINIVIN